MRLHYFVKLEIRAFVKILMLEKRNLRNFIYWVWFHLFKNATFWLWHHAMANLTRKICTKPYQNRPLLVKDMTKHFGVFFGSQF